MATFEVIHKKIPGQGYNLELEDLLHMLKGVEAFCRQFSGVRKKGIPWRENMLKSAFAHLQGGVVWLPEKVKIVEMPGNRAEGGYCRSTKTQVNPSSALKRPKHHQSDQSIVPGILSSSLPQKATVHTSPSPTILTNRIPSPDRIRFPTRPLQASGFYSPHRFN